MRIFFSFIIVWLLLLTSCSSKKDKPIELTLENTAGIDVKDKAVAIKRSDLHLIREGRFHPLVTNNSGDTILSQLDDTDGDGNWDELFLLATIQAGKQEHFHINWVDEAIPS